MARLAGRIQESGLRASTVQVQDAVSCLKRGENAAAPEAIIISAEVEQAITVARDLHIATPTSHIFFIRESAQFEDCRRALSHAPLIGTQWALFKQGDPAIGKAVLDAAQNRQRRTRLRTTLDRANARLSSQATRTSDEYHRLLVSEGYLNIVLAQTNDAIIGLDDELHVLYWNAKAESLFGLPAKAAIGLGATELPFWSASIDASVQKIRRGEIVPVEEQVFITPAEEKHIEIIYGAVSYAANFVGVSLVVRDVSERYRRLAEEREKGAALAEAINRERLRLVELFRQSPTFMAVTRGPHHILEMANAAYYQTFGKRQIGQAVRSAFPELSDQSLFDIRDRVFKSGEAYIGRDFPVTVQRSSSDGPTEIYIDFVYQPIREADGTVSGMFCQGNDVTEQKLARDMLATYQSHLEQLVEERTAALRTTELALQKSQKLEAIGKLTGGVAHDFNNILHVVGANLELLSLQVPRDANVHQRIAVANKAVDRGAKLSAQLLAFARRQPLRPSPTNLGTVLRDLDDLLRRALGEEIEIETIVGGGLWNTLVDRNQLENVILNLALNARDAMDSVGKLTLEVGNAMLDDLYVADHTDVPAGQYVVLAVSDTGKGMSAEIMEHAFEPFFTTKAEGEGTGLGLSMAYGFVKQSEGHIKLYSEAEHGTTVKVYLPRSFDAEEIVTDFRTSRAIGGTETILVVEDDLAVQAVVVDMLSGLGYKVLKADNAESALVVLKTGISIDLLFTDVVMPGAIRSPELARRAKQLHPDIAILFTSGYTQNAIVHGGRLDFGVELISKPYRRNDLARKIRHILANHQHNMQHRAPLIDTPPSDIDAPPPALKSETGQASVLVVEDNKDANDILCEMLRLLGHQVAGFLTAEEAVAVLPNYDVLITDINLPGMSGIELARLAANAHPQMKIIFSSGAEKPDGLQFSAQLLKKPYTFETLKSLL